MFRTVLLYIIGSFSLYTQQWFVSYKFADSVRAGSGRNQFHPDPKFKVSLYSLKYTHVVRVEVILCRYVYVGDNYGAVSYTSCYQAFCAHTRSRKYNQFDVK